MMPRSGARAADRVEGERVLGSALGAEEVRLGAHREHEVLAGVAVTVRSGHRLRVVGSASTISES